MRFEQHLAKKFLIRLSGIFLFATVVCLASDCHAQRQQGWLMRGARVQNGPRFFANRQNPDPIANHSNQGNASGAADAEVRRRYNQRNVYQATQAEAYPKYIGAFHSSHFSNVGVPSGDNGFRGNGIYWAPW